MGSTFDNDGSGFGRWGGDDSKSKLGVAKRCIKAIINQLKVVLCALRMPISANLFVIVFSYDSAG
jgi:hypothetical protein